MADLSVAPSHGQDQLVTAQVVEIPIEYELKRAAEKMEADHSNNKTKIHRYPAIIRRLIKDDHHYFVPSTVAIGPYHRGLPRLRQTEEVKRAAAHDFCRCSGHPAEVVYERILSVIADARSCYADDVVAGLHEADFAAMMFRDGCFVLQYIVHKTDDVAAPWLQSWFISNEASIVRDIFLLDNQLPWPVLDALTSFRSVPIGDFISKAGSNFEAQVNLEKRPFVLDESYTPAHLLGLLRYYQSGLGMSTGNKAPISSSRGAVSVPQSSSAIELAEIGIKLVASKTTQFKDMGIRKGLIFGELFLAPLVMDDQNACWLVNMVALEACSAMTGMGEEYYVSSYVSLLAMLMNREEDVHELRVKRILHGDFSDGRVLAFFKNLVKLVTIPCQHVLFLAHLEAYRRKRWMWIPIHKFIYNNFKAIVTVFSIIGVC